MPQLIDSHCHLPHPKYKKSTEILVEEARAKGVEKIINIGTSVKDTKDAINTSKQFDDVYPTAGIYPHEDLEMSSGDIEKNLVKFITSENVVGIGECGIDVSDWRGGRTQEKQIELFNMQADLSIKYDLPLIIHNRNGDNQILEVIKKRRGLRGVFHCFASSWEFAKKVIDLGFYISFSGIITYPSSKHLLETVKKVPLDKFLVETDAPYLPTQPYRGQPNEPKYVKIVAEKAAEVKRLSFDEICTCTYSNTCALFAL